MPAERPKPGRPRKGADRGYVLPDHPLDYAGQDELVATHKGNTHTATALADGTLRVGDKVAASPSAAQLAAIGVTKNGWRWSRVHRNGRLAWLDDVRDELLARWTWQADHQPRSRSDDVA